MSAPCIAVIATAGSGKTRVMIERAIYLVTQGVRPTQLQFLTFTNAAADEIRRRLELHKLGEADVRTLHSVAGKVLHLAGQSSQLISSAQERRLFEHIAQQEDAETFAWRPEWATDNVEKRLRLAKQSLHILPGMDRFPNLSSADQHLYFLYREVHEILEHKLGKTLRNQDDNLGHALVFLRSSSAARTQIQASYRCLFVDEYQDVSRLQAALIQVLAGGRQLLLVGDPAQSVFSFQGGSPSILQAVYDQADLQFNLTANHRNPGMHLMLATRLLDEIDMAAPLIPASGFEGQLEVHRFQQQPNLLRFLTARIRTLLKESDQATVLVRSRDEVTRLAQHLQSQDFMVSTSLGQRGQADPLLAEDFIRRLLRPALTFLNLRCKSVDSHPLLLAASGVEVVLAISPRQKHFLTAAWQAGVSVAEVEAHLGDQADANGSGMRVVLKLWRQLEAWFPSQESGALLELLTQFAADHALPLPSSDLARSLAKYNPLSALNTYIVDGAVPPTGHEEALHISTIHSAKGREWKTVVLTDLADRKRSKLPEDDAEEYRLRYVALTRATDHLIAFIPESCHPAYRLAFDPSAVQDAQRISRMLTTSTSTWDVGDPALLAHYYTTSPSVSRYLDRFWHPQASPDSVSAVYQWLTQAGVTLLPSVWQSTQLPPQVQPVLLPKVTRIPIRPPSALTGL